MRVNRLVYYVSLIFLLNTSAYANAVTATRICKGKADGNYTTDTGSSIACVGGRVDKANSKFSPDYEIDMFSDNSATGEIVGKTTNSDSGSGATSGSGSGATSGSGSGATSGSGSGATSGSGSGATSGSGSGATSGSGSGATSGSVLPQSMPMLPIPAEFPQSALDKELMEAIQALRKRYQKAFEALKNDEKRYKKYLAEALDNCVLLYGGSSYHDTCAEGARSGFEQNLNDLKKRFETLKRNMSDDFSELLKSAGVNAPSVPNPTINNGNSVSGSSSNGGDINNTTNETNITNETINSTTTNITNNVSGGENGNGATTNVTVKTQDYSGFLGSISGSLNDIKNKLSAFLSGFAGNTQQEPAKKSDDDKKECKKGTLGCSELGSADDVVLPDTDFGIKTQTVDVSKYFTWRRVVGGNETCPAPIKISTSLFVKDIPLQPLCDFAQMIRGVVILIFAMWGMRIALKGDN